MHARQYYGNSYEIRIIIDSHESTTIPNTNTIFTEIMDILGFLNNENAEDILDVISLSSLKEQTRYLVAAQDQYERVKGEIDTNTIPKLEDYVHSSINSFENYISQNIKKKNCTDHKSSFSTR